MKIKLKRNGGKYEIKELLIDMPEYPSLQRVDIDCVEFLPEEMIKYISNN